MDSTGSFLMTVLERIRGYLDADESEKYADDYIVAHVIGPSMVDVLARINMNMDNPVLMRYSITLVTNQQYYQLPPCIQEVWKICIIDTGGRVITEEVPRGCHSPRGFNWQIEANTLSIMPFPTGGVAFDVWYTSNGDIRPHYSTGGGALDSTLSVLTLGTAALGQVDRRSGSYAGQILRLLPSSPGCIEERVIASHNPVAGTVTVRLPFTNVQWKGAWSGATAYVVNDIVTLSSVQYVCILAHTNHTPANATYWRVNTPYEIAPLGSEALYDAIASRSALKLGTFRNISQSKEKSLTREYLSAIKTITDNLANLQARTGKSFNRDGDNTARWRM